MEGLFIKFFLKASFFCRAEARRGEAMLERIGDATTDDQVDWSD